MRARAFVAWVIVIGLATLPAGAAAQGLGDAAKREKARRAEAKPAEPARVYTNDSVGGSPSHGTYSAPGGSAAPAATPTSPSGPAASPVRPSAGSAAAGAGESYWRARAATARSAVDDAEKRVADLEAAEARNGPYTPGQTPGACVQGAIPSTGETAIELRDRAGRSKVCDAEVLRIQNSQRLHAAVATARADLEAARKALADLDDEARRAGALPGWLR